MKNFVSVFDRQGGAHSVELSTYTQAFQSFFYFVKLAKKGQLNHASQIVLFADGVLKYAYENNKTCL